MTEHAVLVDGKIVRKNLPDVTAVDALKMARQAIEMLWAYANGNGSSKTCEDFKNKALLLIQQVL
jgi:hypothetical protein